MRGNREDEIRLPLSLLLTYAAPMAGVGFMVLLINMYLMKFSTDVLLVPPAAMGLIFAVSRVWDAFSDPLAGYLSDRTRSRWGRRRPWLMAAALPLAVAYVLIWSPPTELGGAALTLWVGAALVLFYTGFTVFEVPHASLGAELTSDYRDRNRIFGVRRLCFGLGGLLAVGGLGLLSTATDAAAARGIALRVALAAAAVTGVGAAFTAARMREKPEHQGRGGRRPLRAAVDILRNPHGRLLLVVFLAQQLGVASLTIMTPYWSQYILGRAEAVSLILGVFMLASLAAVPLWVRAGRRIEKKALLVASMLAIAAAIGALALVGEGQIWLAAALAGLGGIGGAGADVVFPSVQADVIDYDEYLTGERKEGVYFAGWAFASKTAGAAAGAIVGLLLSAAGFEPGAEQSEGSRQAILLLFCGLPLACWTIGIALFARFSLGRREHAAILAAIDARR